MALSDVVSSVRDLLDDVRPQSVDARFQSSMPSLDAGFTPVLPSGNASFRSAMGPGGGGFRSAMNGVSGSGFRSAMGGYGGNGGFRSAMGPGGGGFVSAFGNQGGGFGSAFGGGGPTFLSQLGPDQLGWGKARDEIWKDKQKVPDSLGGMPVSGGSGLQGDATKARVDSIKGTDKWNDLIEKAAKEAGVPASVIKGLMAIESGGNASIGTNTSGATGLMQVVGSIWQGTANNYGNGDLNDPWTNIRTAAEILRQNKERYGTWEGSIAAYLGSPVQDDTGAWRGGTVADANGTTGQMYVDVAKNNIAWIEAQQGGNQMPPAAEGYANPWAQGALAFAQQAVGTPYTWGGESYEEGGFDCSGLVDAMYKSQGKNVGRPTSQTIHNTWTAIGRNELKAGDLITYSFPGGQEGADHVAIYIGNGKIVHATSNGGVTKIQNMSDLAANEIGYRRVV